MRNRDEQSYKTLLITLAIIGIFITCLVVTQASKIATNIQQEDTAFAGAQEPVDGTIDPNATEAPDEPLEDDDESNTPAASSFATATPRVTSTPIPTLAGEVFPTETPAPTFAIDIPGETTPTITPSPKPVAKGTSNIALIVGAVVGTILLVIGIVWIILSRQKRSDEYTMPAPPANPAYPPYQPDGMSNTPSTSSEWTQPTEPQAPYTTPYDQYVGSDPNQPKT
jgi:hypothetical protein